MKEHLHIYDLIGIGIGPSGLGLAALCEASAEIDSIFFDEAESFSWHPGMLIDGSDLQSPFLADLVTFADPTNPFSFLNYLHHHRRLYTYYIFQKFAIPRKEYNHYAQWVAKQLENCHFGWEAVDVQEYSLGEGEACYQVCLRKADHSEEKKLLAKHVVLATGSVPMLPKSLEDAPGEHAYHSSDYLYRKEKTLQAKRIAVIGSGQSAAEIFLDLLENQLQHDYELYWLTQANGFYQQHAAKMDREVFSPNYVEYFHSLPLDLRKRALDNLATVRNGIDPQTLISIYDLLYHRSIGAENLDVVIRPFTAVQKGKEINGQYQISCKHLQADQVYDINADQVVFATGFQPRIPDWISRYEQEVEKDADGKMAVSADYSLVFKQKREHRIFKLTDVERSHGTGSTNLALSVQRNQKIINAATGKELYPVHNNQIFQQFSPPQDE